MKNKQKIKEKDKIKVIGKKEIQDALNKVLPPKTEKAIVEILSMEDWRKKQGCDRVSCPFVEIMVKKGEEIEIKEKGILSQRRKSK